MQTSNFIKWLIYMYDIPSSCIICVPGAMDSDSHLWHGSNGFTCHFTIYSKAALTNNNIWGHFSLRDWFWEKPLCCRNRWGYGICQWENKKVWYNHIVFIPLNLSLFPPYLAPFAFSHSVTDSFWLFIILFLTLSHFHSHYDPIPLSQTHAQDNSSLIFL